MYRKFLLPLLIFLGIAKGWGQQDTTKKITVTDTSGYVEIVIKEGNKKKVYRFDDEFKGWEEECEGCETDSASKPKSRRNKNVETDYLVLDLGINSLLFNGNPSLPPSLSNLELNPWASLHVNVGIVRQRVNLSKHKLWLEYGINYDNNDYRFANNIDFKVDSTGNDISYASRQTEGFVRNKLTTRFVTVPLGLHFETKPNDRRHSAHFTVGMHAGYRLTSFFKTVREDEGKRKTKVHDDFLLNNFRYGAYVKAGYGKFTVFANYIFTPLFREGTGPELNTFSFGLVLGG